MSEQAASDHIQLVSDIVSAFVSHNNVPAVELPNLIRGVYESLGSLGKPAEPELVKLTPAVPIRKSVTPDAIISLEDGKPYKSLKRHLTGRGLTPQQYREKWGLPPDYPMVAANYAAARSELAKQIGLGQNRQRAAAEKRAAADAKVSAPAEPKGGRARPKKADA
ncbi:transcriptional regulator, MucR family [Methylobacterium sp. 4-46]|uniref:MucR family transcriptional regulator n=1 Tax=unclassified Methylobacterium TaxID=2615210 RepID=UPI000152D515|nr:MULTISPECIES: MucR family transcriptional regulator [Methylobacterium]ACA20988.1 transcriptional regulator, MucR family [Methylobacterium sp. 4-46]WFT80142.1 MucR family transcriptional regulator [Methylobacterium nodulans]